MEKVYTVEDLSFMPDLPLDYCYRLYNDDDYIVFDNRIFIKRIDLLSINVDTLYKMKDLDIPGFNTHKKIFIDESMEFIYLLSPYLGNHKQLLDIIRTSNTKEILSIYKKMLENVKLAHENGLNPYDIKYTNYLLDENNNPIFIDFDFSVFNGNKSFNIDLSLEHTFFPLHKFNLQELDRKAYNLHDKLTILNMIIQSLNNTIYGSYGTLETIEDGLYILTKDNKVDPNVINHINSIVKDNDIIMAADIKDYPSIYKLKITKIKNSIKGLPLISDVNIKRNLFGKLTIEVKEEKVFFYNKFNNKLVLSDNLQIKN